MQMYDKDGSQNMLLWRPRRCPNPLRTSLRQPRNRQKKKTLANASDSAKPPRYIQSGQRRSISIKD